MILTVYPNNEVRARVPAPVVAVRCSGGNAASLLVNREKLALDPATPLSFLKFPSCPWPRQGYGGTPDSTPFSLYGRRTLSRAGGCFSLPEENRIAFLTGTLPGGTDEAIAAISNHSSWVVHRLMTRIPQVLGVRAAELRWMWVWEWQKRGALHWHCVLETPSSEQAHVLIDQFSRIWASVIDGLSRRSGVDCAKRRSGGTWAGQYEKWRNDAQIAVKEPYRYLAKYLSKGCGASDKGKKFFPKRWYSCSRALLRDLRSLTVVASTNESSAKDGWIITEDDIGILGWLNEISEHTVAFVDRVKSGSTVVFYPDSVNTKVVRDFVRNLGVLKMGVLGGSQRREGVVSREGRSDSACPIEKCISLSHRLERLYGDLGDYYRPILDRFIDYEDISLGDFGAIRHTAERLLYRLGVYQSVIPPKASEAGLTDDAPKSVERQGSLELERLYPGLPY